MVVRRAGTAATVATVMVATVAVLATSVLVASTPVPPSNAAQLVPGLPSAPVITAVTGGDRQLIVSFSPPVTAIGVISYQYSTDGGASWRIRDDGGSTASPVVVTRDSATGVPLVNGTIYAVRLRAVNAVGSGFMSNLVAGTPVGSATVPAAPTAVIAWPTFAGAVVNWTPPQLDGGSPITGYVATASPGGATCSASAPNTWCTISDLSNSSTYTVTVRAINVVGTGPQSQPSAPVTPAPLPGQPTGVVGVAGDARVVVSWTPSGENRGPPVQRFTVTATPGGARCTAGPSATSCTVTGLTNQVAYRFSVVATNNTGDGPPSQPSAPVVPMAAASPMEVALRELAGATDTVSAGAGNGAGAGGGVLDPPSQPGVDDDGWEWLWDPTPASATFGVVVIPGTTGSEPAPQADAGGGTGASTVEPGSRAGQLVDVDGVVTAPQGLAAWCWSITGIARHSVVFTVTQSVGVVVVPGRWGIGSGAASGLGGVGDATSAGFTVSVPTTLEVGRHHVRGTCVDPAGKEVGPGLTGVLDVVVAPGTSR
jgi:hypothetical protein